MNRFYGITISDILVYFKTEQEAIDYFKEFPKGTYKIGECNDR